MEAYITQIEVNLRLGLPSYTLVGLPDSAIKEGFVRVRAALEQVGFPLPPRKITINLAPADIRKDGAAFDLPIALALLASCQVFDAALLKNYLWLGELGLDGTIRSVMGSLPITLHGRKQGLKGIILPASCAFEASPIKDFPIHPVSHLSQMIAYLQKKKLPPQLDPHKSPTPLISAEPKWPDFQDIRGNEIPKRALEIAAAGAHHLLLIGPPGTGKSMLAQRLPSILPPLTDDEALEVRTVYSCAGLLKETASFSSRPFRAPHHDITLAGLIGGGALPRPGEISLAHQGVLFLDELPEFKKQTLEALRQPLEDQKITLVRSRYALTYPAAFSLIAAMNPCPCGFYGSSVKNCICDTGRLTHYRSKISGPLLDRFDLHVSVPPVEYQTLLSAFSPKETSADVYKRVQAARQKQKERYFLTKQISCNANLQGDQVLEYAKLNTQGERLLTTYAQKYGVSNRSLYRMIKVARTIADLQNHSIVEVSDLTEALHLRVLDRPL